MEQCDTDTDAARHMYVVAAEVIGQRVRCGDRVGRAGGRARPVAVPLLGRPGPSTHPSPTRNMTRMLDDVPLKDTDQEC